MLNPGDFHLINQGLVTTIGDESMRKGAFSLRAIVWPLFVSVFY